jgi:cellulose synthase/poly-beta-1,6-N-acetylglucosamine synthase-like glycosyltransferase
MDYTYYTYKNNYDNNVEYLKFSLPLGSVIIVNYNYGRFLRQAIDSIFEQTYPNIECIIIDDVSTDESTVILLDISKQYPSAAIFRRNDNGGQTLAAQEGVNASTGEYVVSSTLRIPVGFASADILQTVESRIVFGTYFTLSEYVRSGRGKR